MDIYLLILTVCSVLVVLFLGILTFKVISVLSETEFLLREARTEASPAFRKLNRILEDIEVVSDQINQQATNANELLDGINADIQEVRRDWKQVSRSWSKTLRPNKDGTVSLVAQVVLAGLKTYFKTQESKSDQSNRSNKEDES